MKEVNVVINGIYINRDDKKPTLFAHSDEYMTLIHFYSKTPCIRLEFKKYKDKKEKIVTVSITLSSNFVISGTLIIDQEEIRSGKINFYILSENTINIMEIYELLLNLDSYSLNYIRCRDFLNNNIVNKTIKKPFTKEDIDELISEILEKIKQEQEQKADRKIDVDAFQLSDILKKEQDFLAYLNQKAIEEDKNQIELSKFLEEYSNAGLERMRKRKF